MKVVFSDRAKADLVSIVEYIARDNVPAAHDLKDAMLQSLASLCDNPRRGKPGRVSCTRELILHKSYNAAYGVADQSVTVLTIRHAARLWPEKF